MEDSKQAFIAQSLRALQVQINELSTKIDNIGDVVVGLQDGYDSPTYKIAHLEHVLGLVAKEMQYLIPRGLDQGIMVQTAKGKIITRCFETVQHDTRCEGEILNDENSECLCVERLEGGMDD